MHFQDLVHSLLLDKIHFVYLCIDIIQAATVYVIELVEERLNGAVPGKVVELPGTEGIVSNNGLNHAKVRVGLCFAFQIINPNISIYKLIVKHHFSHP